MARYRIALFTASLQSAHLDRLGFAQLKSVRGTVILTDLSGLLSCGRGYGSILASAHMACNITEVVFLSFKVNIPTSDTTRPIPDDDTP